MNSPNEYDWTTANPGKVSRYMDVIERIHRQSSPHLNGCRIWEGKKNMHGYGMVKIAKKEHRAHRIVFYALHPNTNPQLVVRHKCDNPACVNPQHLEAGTVQENMMDMVKRGRHRGGAPEGNKNASGNQGWRKGGITAKYASKLGDEVEVPEELL
jgi:hypothetical protein